MKKFMILFLFLFLSVTVLFAEIYQGHYRWRNDDGGEAAATWKGAEDTGVSTYKAENIRLRLELDSGSSSTDPDLSLFYSTLAAPENATGTKITTDGSVNAFKLSLTDNYSEATVAQDRLTNTNYPWAWGKCFESSDHFIYGLVADQSAEFEYCIQPTANAVNGTTYYIVLQYRNTGVNIDGYTHVPAVTVLDNPLPVTLSSFTALQSDKNVILQWTTDSELNNLGFILERKAGSTWKEIASFKTHSALRGQGTTVNHHVYNYTDPVQDKGTITYRLSNINTDGSSSINQLTSVLVKSAVPQEFSLAPAYPNPFNPGTNISYTIAQESPVSLNIIDLLGHTINTLVNAQIHSPGIYTTSWNGSLSSGSQAPSGVYFILLESGKERSIQKVMLIR